MNKELEENLIRFKRARDAMVHADTGELRHHLKEFIREVKRNPLLEGAVPDRGAFDADAWLEKQAGGRHRLTSLDLPVGEDDRLAELMDLAVSMDSDGKNQLSMDGLGYAFGTTKYADSVALAMNIVLRPLAEILSDRIRERVEVANPAIRELAGVPLDRIPAEGETRIFLSHKCVNKPLVQPYFDLLTELGLSPWLDVADMRVGDVVHRGIADGIEHACAVVFFITRDFRDERWLAHEIDHAINRKVERGDRFAIVTLVFDGAEVPKPLKAYIYHEVRGDLKAVQALIRALPIEAGPARWRK